MSLRHRLRKETRASHDIVDAAFMGYDLRAYDGYVRFLSAHLCALQTLASGYCLSDPDTMQAETAPLLAGLNADLKALDAHAPTASPNVMRGYHPTAVRYVLSGSRMGMAFLRKTWARSHDPRVLVTSRFLDTGNPPGHWRDLCAKLEVQSAYDAEACKIISDAKSIFDIYARSGRAAAAPLEGTKYDEISLSIG